MTNYRRSKLVRADLREIGVYTDKEWGPPQRKRYIEQLLSRFDDISEHPNIGKPCDDIRKGYQKYPEGKHIIFYRIGEDGIVEFVRVLHERMDYQQHFEVEMS